MIEKGSGGSEARPPLRKIEDKLQGLLGSTRNGMERARQGLDGLQGTWRYGKIRPHVQDVYLGVEENATALTDAAWISALLSQPGVTPELALKVIETKEKKGDGEQLAFKDPLQEENKDQTVESIVTERGTHEQEFRARFDELTVQGKAWSLKGIEAERRLNDSLGELTPSERQMLSPQISDNMHNYRDLSTVRTDINWVAEMSMHPDVSIATVVDVWDSVAAERERINIKYDVPNETPPSDIVQSNTGNDDVLETLTATGTPEQELYARDGDLDSRTSATNARLREAYDALLSTELTDEQRDTIGTAIRAYGLVSEHNTDQVWVQALHVDTAVDNETVLRAWDFKNELRAKLGKDWERIEDGEGQE